MTTAPAGPGTTPATTTPTTAATPSRTPMLAVLALGVAGVLNAVGTFGDVTDNSTAERGWSEFLVVLAFSAAATAVVFGLVVRTASAGGASRRAVVLGALAVLSIAVFWAGVTTPLAVGAIGCALVARDVRGSLPRGAATGLGLGGLALAAAVAFAVIG